MLLAQFDGFGVTRIGLKDGLSAGEGDRVDIRAEKAPAVITVAQKGIDTVGAGANIQRAQGCTLWHNAVVILCQQVG